MISIIEAIEKSKPFKTLQRVRLIDHLELNEEYEPEINATGTVITQCGNAFGQDTLVQWDNFEILKDNRWYTSSACLEVINDYNKRHN